MYRTHTKLRFTIAGIVVAGAVLATATACSPIAGGSNSGKVLTVLTFGDGDTKFLATLGKEFESAHPGWTVQVNSVPEDLYVTKLKTAVLAKDSPDIASVYSDGNTGTFQPLNSTVYNGGLKLSDFNQTVLQGSCGFQGKMYCVGGYVGGLVLGYDKNAFTKAGIPFPSLTKPLTMPQYAALARKLKAAAGTEFGGDAPSPVGWVPNGVYMNSTGKKAELTNPEYVSTVEAMAGLVADGTAPSPAQLSGTGSDDPSMDLFLKGKLPMIIWDSGAGYGTAPGSAVQVGFAPTPTPAGMNDLRVTTWTNAYGIPDSATHTKQAEEFLTLLGTRGQNLEIARGNLPTRLSDSGKFTAKGDAEEQFTKIVSAAKPDPIFTPDLSSWADILDDTYQTVLRGDSAEAALAASEPKAQQALDTTWVSFEATLKK